MVVSSDDSDVNELLQRSRQQLTKPFAQTQRWLLVLLNTAYLILVIVFLASEKLATGQAVPHPVLGWVYSFVGSANLVSLVYNSFRLRDCRQFNLGGRTSRISQNDRVDATIRWVSVLSLLLMSVCNMSGLGNPSNDSILTDFALGHSLIVLVGMLLGRRMAFAWFLVVLSLLGWVTFGQLGYEYQYNYLTPAEAARYEASLLRKDSWALKRQAELKTQGLNPPLVSRYFNTWLVFILVAFLTSYFCLGITLDVLKVIPDVTQKIKTAIDETRRQELDRERKEQQDKAQLMEVKQVALQAELKNLKAQLNPHFLYNTLGYFYMKTADRMNDVADGVLKLSDIMRYSMRENQDSALLTEEITCLHQYIDLIQLRHEGQLFIDFVEEGDLKQKRILPFLLVGLIENAFKHGRMNKPDCPLKILVRATDTTIEFLTSNYKNGKPRGESNQIGLTNTRKRLELTYPSFVFQINEDEDRFCCQLILETL